jgi:hypothetical protein
VATVTSIPWWATRFLACVRTLAIPPEIVAPGIKKQTFTMRARVYSAPVQQPLRVAFIGEPARLARCVDDKPSGGVEPLSIGVFPGEAPEALHARLAELRPDVVVVLGPGCPAGALVGVPAITLAYLAGPVEPAAAGPEAFDRVIAADSELAAEAEQAGLEVWRVLPLPVADSLYRPASRPPGPARARELDGSGLTGRLDQADVAVNRAPGAGPEAQYAVHACMAAGLLVLSAPLPWMPWLEPDIDFVAADGEERFGEALETLRREPAAFHRQRLGGRLKAEWMRASSVWVRVIGDLRRDVSAFGPGR